MITIRREVPGVYDPLTDTWTQDANLLFPGSAIEVRGNPDQYVPLSLNLSTMPTLLFTPQQYPLRAHTPEFVMPGDIAPWNGVDFVVKAVYPIAPDGNVIMARVVIGV